MPYPPRLVHPDAKPFDRAFARLCVRSRSGVPCGVAVLAVAVVVLCGACSSSSTAHASSSTRTRIIVVMEENHAAVTILGAHDLPNFTRLEHAGTVLTNYFSVGHPSLPNYLAITSGSEQGVANDCGTCTYGVPNLADQLQHAGISWKLYAQGLPSTCPHVVSVHSYARRHVPFLYYDDVVNNPSMCAHIVPYTQFAINARDNRLPTFSMVIPDIDHDMHGHAANEDSNANDGPQRASADAFIGSLYETLRSSSAWKQDTRLVVTWDEAGTDNPKPRTCCGGDAVGGHIATIVVGPRVPHGADGATYDHYALLRSIEDLYHLPRLGKAADANSRDIPSIAR